MSAALDPAASPSSAEDAALLRESGVLDELFYRAEADLPEMADAAGHYLSTGWRLGLEPGPGFSSDFLRPYYSASGHDGPPGLVWAELSLMTPSPLPRNPAEAQVLADRIRAGAVFDEAAYGRQLPAGLDPVTHYVLIGELLGWQPGDSFDPVFYLESNPDLAAAGVHPLLHYIEHGQREGRPARPVVNRLSFPPLPEDGRPVMLFISHDGSRTGAPVLGWNLIRRLSRDYRIVCLMMHGGELEADFARMASVVIGPLVWEEWKAAEMQRIAERLVALYQPLYAVANSIETHLMVPPLTRLGVPVVALVHEFATYTRPLRRMRDIYDHAEHVVFPAQVVARSSFEAFPELRERRGVHIMPQGRSDPTMPAGEAEPLSERQRAILRPPGMEDAFLVLGAGFVHIRKGVDLFIAAAATARRLRPDLKLRFVWIGHGYDPEKDNTYSSYLAEQIAQSDLGDSFAFMDAVSDLEPVYAATDAFFMCSRLDPQPNVGIDAVTRGIPTVCFAGACGTAEILASDPDIAWMVVPHLDAHAAAQALCRLAEDPALRAASREQVARVGARAYDMDAYVRQIDAWGRAAADPARRARTDRLIDSGLVDPDMAFAPGTAPEEPGAAERLAVRQWALWSGIREASPTPLLRRPFAGFQPQVYARAHGLDGPQAEAEPVTHWLEQGRPAGPWLREVFSPASPPPAPGAAPRMALQAHFHYTDMAPELASRLAANRNACDLLLSTDSEGKAATLRHAFRHHHGAVTVRLVPNRGRDIGPFLTGFAREIAEGGYDVVGHVHGKKSISVDTTLGRVWCDFLWENLVGGEHAMLDLAAAAFAARPALGLLMAEDPHIVGWDGNRAVAEALASRMGLPQPLDEAFDFPLGTMFWARPAALRPLLALDLGWEDYPEEPLPYDGTMLHALERLMPFVARHAGFTVGGLRAPGTSW
ncbi:rhamnan synthesis F family protein [Teichococcus aestuarii]|uniref:rhamnan synthesis F family protein n=1 Tax=Teichococcus aestuarii TaxID=568898 RepID=UPI003609B4C8